ncbi:MAG: tetratricopeptide repeat protein [Proteobacteria bacterium]|nr:tetratricopeptide repeat protein [Pseudomonadota bacterium]
MQDLQNLFAEAVSLHQANKLVEAEKLYLQVHSLLPDNINVLANLGIVCRDLGKLGEAEVYCRQTLAAAPDDPAQHLNLGAVLEAASDLSGARIAYEKALQLAPSHPKILNNLGKLLHQQGYSERGLELIEQAIRMEPNYPLALNNLGVIHSERGDLDLAGKCLEKSVNLDPDNVNALYNLAGLYNAQNNFIKAQTLLTRVLSIDPNHQAAHHMLAALCGTSPPSAPRQYVEEIFDKYAHRFDVHLEEALGYTAPSALASMVREALGSSLPFAAALDLGCGTGLSGASFREIAGRLVGVDVSRQMLAKAREKKLYDRLEQEEILAFLKRDAEYYDLFIAADVLVYLGDPKPLFPALAARTRGNGIVACSIEETQNVEGYALLPSGRYAHNPTYLVACADDAGFSVLVDQPHRIRKENGEWLAGALYLFIRKEASDSPREIDQVNPQTP